jgi:NhaP-type Na+/H+ or K+/H+ antiporter
MNRRMLYTRLWRSAQWAGLMIAVALVIGMAGYVYFGDHISWSQAFADAAMILAGEGPLDQMKTPAGNIFEGIYALICGFLFFAIAGFALAPALHHVLRRFHLEDEERAATSRRSHN